MSKQHSNDISGTAGTVAYCYRCGQLWSYCTCTTSPPSSFLFPEGIPVPPFPPGEPALERDKAVVLVYRDYRAEIESLRRELEEAQAERDRWADAATMQNDEIEAVLGELEKAGWNGPASPGVEHLRYERDEAQVKKERLERTLARAQRIIGLLHIERGELIERLATLCGEERKE